MVAACALFGRRGSRDQPPQTRRRERGNFHARDDDDGRDARDDDTTARGRNGSGGTVKTLRDNDNDNGGGNGFIGQQHERTTIARALSAEVACRTE